MTEAPPYVRGGALLKWRPRVRLARPHLAPISDRQSRAAEVVLLANLQPIVAKDVIGRSDVEIEVWHRELKQIIDHFERHLLFPNRKSDIPVFHSYHPVGISALNEGNSSRKACFKLFKRSLFVFPGGWVHPRKSANTAFSVIACKPDLMGERKHVGKQSGLQHSGGVDLVCSAMANCLVNDPSQTIELPDVDRN
jgi:hypothetical protein